MATVADVLGRKGNLVHGVEPGTTVFEAIKTMVAANCGSVLVMEDGAITGIFTERDYLRKVSVEGRSSKTTYVADVMSSPVVVIAAKADVDEALALMTDRRVRHLPVVEDERVVGVVSIGDLVKHKTREQAFQIKYLEDYISGR